MSSVVPPFDHFPSTHRTWIDQQLTIIAELPDSATAHDAHRALAAFVMNRYQAPLCAYVGVAALRDLGEPQELVASFFARSFESPQMMQRWAISGITLRRWLMNAISLHCRSLRRDRARSSARLKLESDFAQPNPLAQCAEPANDLSPERAFDRAWALAIANEAHELARIECASDARDRDYEAFRLHLLDGLEHREIALRLQITHSQSKNAVRRVAQIMRRAVSELLRAEGVEARDLEKAVDELIDLTGESSS